MLTVGSFRRRLEATPVTTDTASQPAERGGLPLSPGLYSWWIVPGSLTGIAGPPHPTEQLELLYLGISPSRASSSATLRSRVRGQHLGGNIGSSTFRFTLAALLAPSRGWIPHHKGSRPVLTPEGNRALSMWQRDHLRLTWATVQEPWRMEPTLIASMQPPLNLAGADATEVRARISRARRSLLASAVDSPA